MNDQASILIAQIDALMENLQRSESVLRNESLQHGYRQPIYGKFARAISPLMRRLESLRKTVTKPGLTGDELANAWESFAEANLEGQRVFAQCLDFLGGIAVRRMGLESGICTIAEQLVSNLAQETGGSWSAVILGEERLFDNVAQITQIIRLRFPEWDIWSLPFTAYEFGQLIVNGESVRGLREFLADEERRLRRLIEDVQLQQAELQAVASAILALRSACVGTHEDPRVEHFLGQQRHHLHNLFADIFATYFLGPAYIYAWLFLRLRPRAAFVADPESSTPIEARRLAVMLSTLRRMSESAKRDPYAPGPYDNELLRFETLWEHAVKPVAPGFQADFTFGAPYDSWFEQLYNLLHTEYGLVGFKTQHWEKASALSNELLQFQPVTAALTAPIILNAAWHCRVRNPERVEDIAKRARQLLTEAAAPLPGVSPAPQQITQR